MSKKTLPKGFWKMPEIDPNKTGDSNPEEIWKAVGKTLSRWGKVEEALCFLFIRLCMGWDSFIPQGENKMDVSSEQCRNAFKRVFGTITSDSGRRDALRAAAESYFKGAWKHKSVYEPFNNLMADVRTASMRRNEIAHGTVEEEDFNLYVGAEKKEHRLSGCFLCATSHSALHNEPKVNSKLFGVFTVNTSKYRLNSSEIYTIESKFESLRSAIFNYIDEISIDISNPGLPKNITPEMLVEQW